MMTLKERHQQKLEALVAARAAAAEAVAQVAARAKKKADRGARQGAPDKDEPLPVGSSRLTLAARHRAKYSALAAAAAAGATEILDVLDSDLATPANLMLLQLSEDKAKAKGLQSNQLKAELKRDLLPKYDAWVEEVMLAAESAGKGIQDDVVMTVMIWRIDAGDFLGGLQIAEYALKFELAPPNGFKRTVATLVAEQIAEAALQAPADKPIPHGILDQAVQLLDGRDMPDEVMAQLLKAHGLELTRLADNPPESQDIASWRPAHLTEAVTVLKRALSLDDRCGVKGEITKLEKALQKEPPPAPETQPEG